MIVKQKANVYARALGLSEVQNAKLTAAALITALVAAVCVAAITVTLFFTFKELRAAEADRVMHGYIGKDGHFISAKVTPDHYVKAFVNDFILHYFNLSPETVEDRLNYARKMMAPNYRIREEQEMIKVAKSVDQRQVEQIFSPIGDMTIIPREDGFIVQFKAVMKRLINNRPYTGDEYFAVQLRLARVHSDSHYEWGMVVADRKTKKIKKPK